MPRTRRSFSPQFQAKTVLDLLSGASNQAEICRKHKDAFHLCKSYYQRDGLPQGSAVDYGNHGF